MMFDNETTSKTTFPSGNAATLLCVPVDNVADNTSVLIPTDGHIWAAERNGMMCARVKNAVESLASGKAAVVNAKFKTGDKLHTDIYDTVCDPLDSLTTYLRHLALNLTELKKAISLSGDNTKVIEKADNSTKALMTAVGCKE